MTAGQTGTSPTGTLIPIISGDVQLDGNASIRATLDMTTDGTGMFPDNASDLLTPYGNELFARVCLVFGGGAVERVSLGYFRIQDSSQSNAPDGPIQIGAQDRMAGIIDYRLPAPVQFQSTDTYGSVVTELVQDVYPWATVQWDDLSYTNFLGRSVVAEEDRYDFLNELITSLGKIWYWDHRGILVIKNVPAEDDPVWNVNSGENGVLVSMSRELTRDGVYNAMVVTGEALDDVDPVRAMAVDDNPASPTYFYGPFGKVTTFYNSSFITTVGQAQTAADALLTKKLGLPYNVDFQSIRNPALEPYDPVIVNITGSKAEQPAVLIQDSFERTVVDSWGTADNGVAWTLSGTAANFDVTAGAGTSSIASGNVTQNAMAAGAEVADVEGHLLVSVPNVATGAALILGGLTRASTGNGYHYRIEFGTDGRIGCKLSKFVGGAFSEIAANNPVPGLTYSAGQVWRVRFRNFGTTLRMKVWIDGESEPSSWTLATTDTSLAAGSVGAWFWKQPTNTNTGVQMKVHEYEARTYPGYPSDAELHIIEKMTVPLTNDQPMTATTREQTLVVIGEA